MANVKELPEEVMQDLEACTCGCGILTGKGGG